MKRPQVIRAWGGFCDGVLDMCWRLGDRPDITPIYSIFKTRASARRCYGDVRRIEIREVPRKGRKP